MSFFFDKAKKAAPKRGSVPKSIGSNPSSKDTLNRLGCKACPLDKAAVCTPKMQPRLEKNCDIYLLGSGPSKVDDDAGKPFSDRAAGILHSFVPRGVHCCYDNVVRDYDGAKQSPSWIAMECCRSLVTASIEKAKPAVIVGLGIQALQWMLGSSDMIGLRGRVFAVRVGSHECWFMPTYDPHFVMQQAFAGQDPTRSKLGHCLKFDVARAVQLARSGDLPRFFTVDAARGAVQAFSGVPRSQLAAVLKLISEARKAPVKAIDIETNRLRPYGTGAKVLTCAISTDDSNFAFAIDHPKAGWNSNDKKLIKEALAELLSDQTTIVAHNAPFEVEWLIALLGKEAIFHDVWDCTMMQAHFLDERRGKRGGNDEQFQPNPYQALDFLIKQYFGLSYKGAYKLDRKNMEAADLKETLLYNGADTLFTLALHKHQIKLLKMHGLLDAYEECRQRQPTVALMQSLGIHVDQATNRQFAKRLTDEVSQLEKQIYAISDVQRFIADNKSFNPSSGPDVIKLFKSYAKVGKKILNAEGKESTDKNTLAKIDHPLAKLLEPYRNRLKLKSTYVDEFELGRGSLTWPDGKIHPTFNTTFTETGRTSCAAGWTPVLTDTGVKLLKDVCVNDLVWTHKQRWRKVTALWRKGVQLMFDVHLSNGSILTCTKNHRLLDENGTWKTVGELYGVFKEVGQQASQCGSSAGVVQIKRHSFSEGNCQKAEHVRVKYLVGDPEQIESKRTQNFKDFEIFSLQAWRQKPNERVGWREVPTLERHLQRQQRLFHDKNWRETNFSSSSRIEDGAEPAIDPTRLGSTSYRRRSSEQPSRQFSSSDSKGASSHSLTGAAGQQVIAIEKIAPRGSCEVFDITVEEDASYETCGVFSHNSDSPNQQNWPSRNDKWVRKQLAAKPGHVLVAFDYGQLEACTAAMCSRDKTLVNALWDDYDIHMEWAHKIVDKYPAIVGGKANKNDPAVMKKFRSLVKNKMVFPAMFGASNTSVAGYLGMPQDVIDRIMSEFWRTFHGLYGWQKRLMKDYYDMGYVESPTGRRRHYPLTKNQAINYPIQSLGCDIVCRAMVTLSAYAAQTGKWYLHPIMNIHDDLSFEIPDRDEILEPAIEKIYKVMLNTTYFDFINVPLSVSCSIGQNWLEMDEIDKFWSHKDV